MECKELLIGKPYIEKFNNQSSLKANIIIGDEIKVLAFTVDNVFEKYLVTERSDAFVVAILYYALIKGYNIRWETPCNNRLIYQLNTYFIPIYVSEFGWANEIKLYGPTTTEILVNENGIATGLSNGVDSIYTVRKYLTDNTGYGLTHVLFTDCFITDNSEEYQNDYIDKYLSILPQCARELGLGFIYVKFRPDVDFSVGHIVDKERGVIQDVGLFTLKYCSLAMSLGKLLKIYYFSGGVSPSDFSFKKNDMAYHDIFTLPLISSDNLTFYSSGLEINRLEKVRYIADWNYAQKYLQVCAWDNDRNCGHCSKCLRTMSELNAIGMLEKFDSRFPVNDYRKHYHKRFGKVMMEVYRGHIFEVDVIKEMKKNRMRIPVSSRILGIIYFCIDSLRLKLRTNKMARKIYRKYHLDEKLYGRSTLNYSLSVDREIIGSNNE